MREKEKADKEKPAVIHNPDGSITIKVNTPEGPVSTTYWPNGTKVQQVPTPTGSEVRITFGKGKKGWEK